MITQIMRLDTYHWVHHFNRFTKTCTIGNTLLAGQSGFRSAAESPTLLLEDKLTQEVTGETAQQTLMIEKTSFNKICNAGLILAC